MENDKMKEAIKKLKFKAEAVVLNAPLLLEEEFVKMNFSNTLKSKNSNTLVFVNNSKECVDFFEKHLQKIEPDTMFWIAYPKGSSGIKTDINRDILMRTGLQFKLKSVSLVAIDGMWSAMRFRPIDKVGT